MQNCKFVFYIDTSALQSSLRLSYDVNKRLISMFTSTLPTDCIKVWPSFLRQAGLFSVNIEFTARLLKWYLLNWLKTKK